MLTDFLTMLTETVRGWWLGLAGSPWLSLLVALLLLIGLPALGFVLGRLLGRRSAPVAAPMASDALDRLREAEASLRRERDQALEDLTEARAAFAARSAEADGDQQSMREAADGAQAALTEAQAALEAREADLDAARAALAEAEAAMAAARQEAADARGDSETARRALRDAEGRAAEATARAEDAEQRAASADAAAQGEALVALVEGVETGAKPISEALAAAEDFVAMQGHGLAAAARLRAMAALAPGGDGLATARRHVAAAQSVADALTPAEVDALAVLAETLDAALGQGERLGLGPRAAGKAGLPRLAELRWLHEAEAASDDGVRGAALAGAAEAALWGARWPQAAALAARAVTALDGWADDATLLGARLTQAQARLFTGAEDGAALIEAVAHDAAEALGGTHATTIAARRLLARAAFERGDVRTGEATAALLSDSPIDPTTDPGIRAARGRGLMAVRDFGGARGLFEALARQASEGSRTALGHRLDALEARLADGDDPRDVLDALEPLVDKVGQQFGTRHPRAGQAALLTATARGGLGETVAAAEAFKRAEAILSLRLDPAHRWRQAAEKVRAHLAEGTVAPAEIVHPPIVAASPDDAERLRDDPALSETDTVQDTPDLPEQDSTRRGPLLAEADAPDEPDDAEPDTPPRDTASPRA
jgi:hypothetical protein